MPEFLEKKLRQEYGNNARAIYGTMNDIGAMHGNKETAKGREMERKHEDKMAKAPFASTEIEHHDDGSHTVKHRPHVKRSAKSPAFMESGEPKSYSAGSGSELMSKLKEHLKLTGESPKDEAEEEGAGGEGDGGEMD